jgi:hypothetical protein
MGALNQSGGRSFKKWARVDKTGVKGGTVSLGKRSEDDMDVYLPVKLKKKGGTVSLGKRSEDDMDVYLPVKLKKSKEGSVQGEMRIGSLNCRGLGNGTAIRGLLDFQKKENPDILFLSETKMEERRIDWLRWKLGCHI